MALNDYPKGKQRTSFSGRKEVRSLTLCPGDAVKTFLRELDGQTKGTFTGINNEGVFKLTLEGEDRLQAVRDYFEMLFEFGVRERPADGGN